MASIMADRQQEKALVQVNEFIEQIRVVNTLLEYDQQYTVSNGTKKTSIRIDESLSDKIVLVLKKQKDFYAKEIQKLTQKFRIQLDDEDMMEIKKSPDKKPTVKQSEEGQPLQDENSSENDSGEDKYDSLDVSMGSTF